jgi:phage-related protein
MEPIPVKKIEVTVETTSEDGSVSNLKFRLDPYTFQMSQSRDVRPVYGDSHEDCGRAVSFEVDPLRRGTRLSISGNVIKEAPES